MITRHHHTPPRPRLLNRFGVAWARGLGWFSIGLGVAEVLAPQTLTRWLGLQGQAALVRAYGIREVTNGVGLLRAKDPTA